MPKITHANGPTFKADEEPEVMPEWDGSNCERSTQTTENPKDENETSDPNPAPTTVNHSSKGQTDKGFSVRRTGGKN